MTSQGRSALLDEFVFDQQVAWRLQLSPLKLR